MNIQTIHNNMYTVVNKLNRFQNQLFNDEEPQTTMQRSSRLNPEEQLRSKESDMVSAGSPNSPPIAPEIKK